MILVTGAAGSGGSLIVKEFASRGIALRALVRDRRRAATLDALQGVEVVEAIMTRPETLRSALQDVHRALMISSSDEQMSQTQRTFIDSCCVAGVPHVVKFSGKESGIGFDGRNFRFTRMHEEVEAYLEASGLAWTHLRPSQFMQVYLREIPTIVARRAFFVPADDIALSPVDLEDVAKVAVSLLVEDGHEGRAYEMTGPEALTMAEIASRISDAAGVDIRYANVTRQKRRAVLLAKGVPPDFVDALDEQAAECLKHPESRIDLSTHERFGVRPTTFAEFARRHAADFRGATVPSPGHVGP